MAPRWDWARSNDSTDPRIAMSFAGGLGFVATLAAAAGMSALRGHLPLNADVGIMAALVVLAAWWMTWAGALTTAAFAWLMLNSFVESRDATLRWHGSADLTRLIVLFACVAAAATVRSVHIRLRRPRLRVDVYLPTDRALTGERHA